MCFGKSQLEASTTASVITLRPSSEPGLSTTFATLVSDDAVISSVFWCTRSERFSVAPPGLFVFLLRNPGLTPQAHHLSPLRGSRGRATRPVNVSSRVSEPGERIEGSPEVRECSGLRLSGEVGDPSTRLARDDKEGRADVSAPSTEREMGFEYSLAGREGPAYRRFRSVGMTKIESAHPPGRRDPALQGYAVTGPLPHKRLENRILWCGRLGCTCPRRNFPFQAGPAP